jgi:secreted PhoX family phosphatase
MWVQTDVSPNVLLKDDHAIYGNNQMLAVDPVTREARRFLTGPRGCEITGAMHDARRLHPVRQRAASGRRGALGTDPGQSARLSNWPDHRPDGRPRSATLAIRRVDGGPVGT